MKRFFLSIALWVVISAAMICAGCRPSQPAPASSNKGSPSEPAKPTAAAPAAAALSDKVLNPPEPAKLESAEPAPSPQSKPESTASVADKVDTPVAPTPTAAVTPDTILVKVNDKIITQGDLDKETKSVEKMMLQRGLSEKQFAAMLTTFKPQILDGLVTQTLINDECVAKKIAISDDDVKKEIDTIRASLPKTTSLEAVLQQQGISQSMLEEQIKDHLKIEKLLNIKVSDEDVKKFYDDNQARLFETLRARHILIKTEPTDDAAAKTIKKEKAEKLRKQIVDGGDFAALAKDNSDCPSKEYGGELKPPFRRGQMVKAFEEVAFNQKTNEISQVVETDFGYHVIQTLEYQVQPFNEVKGRIMAMLKGKKTQQEAEPMLKIMKKNAKLTYLNGATPPPETMFPSTEGALGPVDSSTGDKPESKAVATDKPADKAAKSPDAKDKPAGKDTKPAK